MFGGTSWLLPGSPLRSWPRDDCWRDLLRAAGGTEGDDVEDEDDDLDDDEDDDLDDDEEDDEAE